MQPSNLKKTAWTTLAYLLCLLQASPCTAQAGRTVNITDFGARGDNQTLNTDAINNAILDCAKAGGGTVTVPAGNYLTGTVVLQSKVTLHLDPDARIIGTADLAQYRSFKLTHSDPEHPINITVRDSIGWCKALVMIDHVHDASITGTGTIDGGGVLNKLGEEGRRGPHGIYIGDAQHINLSGIRMMRAGNYNILGLYVEDLTITGITVLQGADGIHIRSGKNILIEDCKCYTADDCIAGGYWQNMVIRDCLLNSSCNGIRVILPASELEVANCQIFGPGVFGHPRGTPANPLITRTLTGIILQAGAWGLGKGNLEKVYLHDIRIRDMQTAFNFVLNEGNNANDINMQNIIATGITDNACAIEAWPDSSRFKNLVFKNIDLSFAISDTTIFSTKEFDRPQTESRPVPYWGFYLRHVDQATFENVIVRTAGKEKRPLMGFDDVGKVALKNVHYTNVPGVMPFSYDKSVNITKVDCNPLK